MTYATGACYDGQWKNGEKHGTGKYVSASGEKYEGVWECGDLKTRFSTRTSVNRTAHQGELADAHQGELADDKVKNHNSGESQWEQEEVEDIYNTDTDDEDGQYPEPANKHMKLY